MNKIVLVVFFFQAIVFSVLAQQPRTSIALNNLKQALLKANSGDTLVIKNGTYLDLRTTLSYSGEGKVVIVAEEPGKVIVSGKSTIIFEKSKNIIFQGVLFKHITNPSAVIIFNSNEIEISNNYFYKCGSNPFHTIVKIQENSSRNRVCNNTFEGSKAMSVVVKLESENDFNNTHNEICGNIFYDIQSVSSIYKGQSNGMEAIQVGQGANSQAKLFTKIYHNRFEKVFGDGAEIISIKSSNNEIFKNVFLDNKSGITLRIGDNVAVFDNYIENTSQGIRVFGSGHKIYNNYMLNCDVAIQIPSTDISFEDKVTSSGYRQQNNIHVYDNTIVGGVGRGILIGDNKRDFNPINLRIKGNSIVVEQGSKGMVLSDEVSSTEIAFSKNIIYHMIEEKKPEFRTGFKNNAIRYQPIRSEGDTSTKLGVKRNKGGTTYPTMPDCPGWRCPSF